MKGCLLALIGIGAWSLAAAQQVPNFSNPPGPNLSRMGIDQKLGAQVPMDTQFTDETGKTVRFGDLFAGRPVLLVPMFYQCHGICEVTVEALLKTTAKLKKTSAVGEKFDVILLSIHPKETPEQAMAKKREILEVYERPQSAPSWHCLTGSLESIHQVTDAVGFRYDYKPETDQINHPAGAIILTPRGMVSSYIFGVDYPTIVLEDGFALASREAVGKKAEPILLGCIMLDPLTGKRTLVIENVLKLAGMLTVLILGLAILKMSLAHRTPKLPGGVA
ncbi:MAG: SCO family protein [Fimbriimonas ginsengisoli]|nr:SCO family protein [Fimbriimonas ginsengisoli]